MSKSVKLTLAGLAAAIVLAFAVGDASARRFQTSEQGFLARWSSFVMGGGGGEGISITCPMTLEGSFHSRTFSKVCGALIGYVSVAQMPVGEPPCTGGTVTILTETLPWHVRYVSFAGTLPRITRLRFQLVNTRAQIQSRGTLCLTGSSATHPDVGDINIGVGGEGATLVALPEFTIPLGGEFICEFAGEAHVSGTAELFTLVTPQGRITVRLVQ